MKVYAFVDAQKTDFTITTLCRVCGVSTSGFYDWAGPLGGRTDRRRARRGRGAGTDPGDASPLEGPLRRTADHRPAGPQGVAVNHKRVERLMAATRHRGSLRPQEGAHHGPRPRRGAVG